MQTLEQLEKFAHAGRIAFREDETAPIVVLVAPGGATEISLYGANVISYRPTGHAPLFWLADSAHAVEPGVPIRGGIPICWPWFGRIANSTKPMHGCVRTEMWHLSGAECDSETTSATFALEETESTLSLWPHRFHLELTVTVGKTLNVALTTTNTDDKPFSITEALHTYFRVREASDVIVTGFDGEPYYDKVADTWDNLQSGAIAFSGEVDRVYMRHGGTAIIKDPGIGRRIIIEKKGSCASVVWNPWSERCVQMQDMKPDDWHRFICVETANAGGEPITIAPGTTHTIAATYTAVLEQTQA